MGLESGLKKAVTDFVLMQLQLAPIFFKFSLGTKTHYDGRTLLHGGAQYKATSRGFVVFHSKFADNYRALLPTKATDEFKPFSRCLLEFKFCIRKQKCKGKKPSGGRGD